MALINPSGEHGNKALPREIFAVLSNEDALRIFDLASTGIEARRSVIQEHDFSKKRYYVRLKELVDIGLVAKENGQYVHTALGRIVYETRMSVAAKMAEYYQKSAGDLPSSIGSV